MTTYAVADQVPPECDYITAGKKYEVIGEGGGWLWFLDDSNEILDTVWETSAHLNGGNWRQVER